ncbi:MAG TPA: iron ABC transporter permease [Gammaproteobacteria bacterium]|jgi:iron complex transport system permease protein|nr:iron ABC transporter permease [Gammaproteobacteria bacterium]
MITAKLPGLIILFILAMVSIFFSLLKGSIHIDCYQLFCAFRGHSSPDFDEIIWRIRLPRALSAFVTGALLSIAGAIVQVLLKNPLADPYILGVSGGAGVVSLLFILCGFSGLWITFGAWLGSIFAILLVFLFIQRKNIWHSEHVLLTGVALASGFSAIISFILLTSENNALHSMLYWLLGDLSDAHFPFYESIILLLALLVSFCYAKELNLLKHGEMYAEALGVATKKMYRQLYFLCALLTATAVGLAGCIGFVGLIVPHIFRRLVSADHRLLLPGSALLGGTFLTFADTVSRTLFAPLELPVGMIMAFLGIPFFIFLLQKKQP